MIYSGFLNTNRMLLLLLISIFLRVAMVVRATVSTRTTLPLTPSSTISTN